jgi:sulfide dehydrogenase [flavocytochrome c] flavoprotein chain
MERRKFFTTLGVTALGLPLLKSAFAGGSAFAAGATGKVVVVGGGMAGTTAAKFLKLWGGSGIEVTLVEPNAAYISNIFSNMVLTGERTLSQLTFSYSNLKNKYGVNVQPYSVSTIDAGARTVRLSNGTTLSYDRLILAPGIDFEQLPLSGTTANQSKIVHAWKAGTQTTSLQNQIKAMTKSDTYILTIPPKPYRCPPGPYERACVVADYLKRTKGGGKVIILDANDGIQAEPVNFTNAFNVTHKGIITYIPKAELRGINADKMEVSILNKGNNLVETYKGKVINAIPTHKAGDVVFKVNGLANNPLIGTRTGSENKWAVVNVLTYESTAVPKIHVIGDACFTANQPKAGHIANTEAKVCAAAIIELLKDPTGITINPTPVTNSSCFTPITSTTASWLSVVFKYQNGAMVPVGGAATESNGANSSNYEDMLKWFNNLMSDTFV